MQYRQFGATGVTISRLGFGSMRLPTKEVGDARVVDEDLSIAMIQTALDRGVNYVDTALFYCDGESEVVVGKALADRRDEVSLSTKYPVSNDKSLREVLETQLGKLATDHIDFYHLHGIGAWFLTHEKRDAILADAARAKDEGLIRHLSFSFHDKPEVMAQLIDLGVFSSVLCQYNLLDRANEDALANAKAKGLGTVVMGPVGGGRIAGLPPDVARKAEISVAGSVELALRFVFANPNVDCAISGMSTMEQVLENTAIAANTETLTEAESAGVKAMMEENKRLADLYCTGCNYCVPHCPEEINIPHIFQAMNYLRVYGLKEYAFNHYNAIGGKWVKGKKADLCRECGECETHCPQKIEIRRQLKECLEVFGAAA
ncbi:MAG: 4Fe-4S dicluster domain-containing protein [Armatimonadetes bacterium]|nr:4Fe-4S dicluster domain-containing protein [Armatimonadota bacterium]